MKHMDVRTVALAEIDESPDQQRYEKTAVAELAASIKEVGLLEPPVLVADGERYRIVAGHRRVAALRKLRRKDVSAVIVENGDRGRYLGQMMATNVSRVNLTPVEEGVGYQQMLDVGVDAATVAKVVGRQKDEVAAAARAAVAFSPEQMAVARDLSVSFEQLAALERHADSEERFKKLLDGVELGGFEWRLREADKEKENEAARAEATKLLEEAGVPIVTHHEVTRLDRLRTAEGEKLTAENHADCPGHCAYLTSWGTTPEETIVYCCSDAEGHGHEDRWAQERRGGHMGESEQNALNNEWRKRQKEPVASRREWLAKRLRQKKALPGAHAFLLETALNREFEKPCPLALTLLGITPAAKDKDAYGDPPEWREQLRGADPHRATLALACAAGDEAVRLSKHPDTQRTYADYHTTTGARYLRFLRGLGYELSDVEQELVTCDETPKDPSEYQRLSSTLSDEAATVTDEDEFDDVEWDEGEV